MWYNVIVERDKSPVVKGVIMYKIEYRNEHASYCVGYYDNIVRIVRSIERKGGTVLAIKRLEVAI